jgi:hypothetical protein
MAEVRCGPYALLIKTPCSRLCRAFVHVQCLVRIASLGNVQLLQLCLAAGAPVNHPNRVSVGQGSRHAPQACNKTCTCTCCV